VVVGAATTSTTNRSRGPELLKRGFHHRFNLCDAGKQLGNAWYAVFLTEKHGPFPRKPAFFPHRHEPGRPQRPTPGHTANPIRSRASTR